MSGSRSRLEKRPLVAPHIASLPKSGIRDFFDLVDSLFVTAPLAALIFLFLTFFH